MHECLWRAADALRPNECGYEILYTECKGLGYLLHDDADGKVMLPGIVT